MPYYRQVGDIPRKRHSYVPADGGLRFEELMGHDGFAQESSLLYHRGSPSAIVAAEVVHGAPAAVTPDLPVLPRHFRTDAIADRCRCGARTGRAPRQRGRPHRVVRRDDRQRALPRRDRRPTRLRPVRPRCARVQLRRDRSRPRRLCRACPARRPTAGASHPTTRSPRSCSKRAATCACPRKYLTDRGQFREGAPFSERDLRGPDAPLVVRRRRRSRVRAHTRRADPARALDPPVRRRRMGRLRMAVRVLDPRLRTDRRCAPPTPARAPDVRRRRTSSCARSCRDRSTSARTR